MSRVDNQNFDEAHEAEGSDGENERSMHSSKGQSDSPPPAPQKGGGGGGGGVSADGELKEGYYNPAEYSNLQVTPEIRDLFDFIMRYKPTDVPLETKLKPFIPDYIPSVGDIDAFLKIPPPDATEDGLGLKVLDEPAGRQSDPTVLEIQLNLVSKGEGKKPVSVRSIENADKNPKKISNWIQNIEEVHRKKPPPVVTYSKPMPHINRLMKAWPEDFEQHLQNLPLPPANLKLEVGQFSRVVCALLDIPVYDKIVESLHVLFSLYSEFQNNVHFQS